MSLVSESLSTQNTLKFYDVFNVRRYGYNKYYYIIKGDINDIFKIKNLKQNCKGANKYEFIENDFQELKKYIEDNFKIDWISGFDNKLEQNININNLSDLKDNLEKLKKFIEEEFKDGDIDDIKNSLKFMIEHQDISVVKDKFKGFKNDVKEYIKTKVRSHLDNIKELIKNLSVKYKDTKLERDDLQALLEEETWGIDKQWIGLTKYIKKYFISNFTNDVDHHFNKLIESIEKEWNIEKQLIELTQYVRRYIHGKKMQDWIIEFASLAEDVRNKNYTECNQRVLDLQKYTENAMAIAARKRLENEFENLKEYHLLEDLDDMKVDFSVHDLKNLGEKKIEFENLISKIFSKIKFSSYVVDNSDFNELLGYEFSNDIIVDVKMNTFKWEPPVVIDASKIKYSLILNFQECKISDPNIIITNLNKLNSKLKLSLKLVDNINFDFTAETEKEIRGEKDQNSDLNLDFRNKFVGYCELNKRIKTTEEIMKILHIESDLRIGERITNHAMFNKIKNILLNILKFLVCILLIFYIHKCFVLKNM